MQRQETCFPQSNTILKLAAWHGPWMKRRLSLGHREARLGYSTPVTTWQQIAILEGHTHIVQSLSLFQNERLLASASYDRTARLWNLDTNLPVGVPLQHQSFVHSSAISADGKLLVTGCADNNAYLWDIHTMLKDDGHEDLLSIPNVNTPTSVPPQY